LCTTTVPRNIRLAEAPSHGKAALVYDPRSKGAESYIKLAKEIIDRQAPVTGDQWVVASEPAAGLVSEAASVDGLTTLPSPGLAEGAEEHRETPEAGVEEIPAKEEMDKTA
jgi:hypothetical protein